jgi:peptidoglycan/LPS O-acetylase OafA/YrhL
MKSQKNLEIERLRAVAILITLYAHISFMYPFHEMVLFKAFAYYSAWVGVDLFFAISGYVIAASAADMFDDAREKGQFAPALKQFWIKRCFRLLPSAWLWVLIPLILAMTFNSTGIFGTVQQNITSITSVLTFTGNLGNVLALYLGPNGVYWSLALEEQFYFIFPIFLLLCTQHKHRVAILLGLILIQFFIPRNPFGEPPQGLIASFRVDGLMWGILLYWFTKTQSYRDLAPNIVSKSPVKSLLLSLLLIYLLGAVPSQTGALPIALGLVAIISALLVWLASYNMNLVLNFGLLNPILHWAGSRSYGMYLIHVPAYRITREGWTRYCEQNNIPFDGNLTLEMLITAAILIVVLAELNFRLVETPLRDRGRRIANAIRDKHASA